MRASARAGTASTDDIGSTKSSDGDGGKEDTDYKTFLGHLYDLLEDKINADRYDEGVRQLVGNQVYQNASPGSLASGIATSCRPGSINTFFNISCYCTSFLVEAWRSNPTLAPLLGILTSTRLSPGSRFRATTILRGLRLYEHNKEQSARCARKFACQYIYLVETLVS